MYYNCKNSQKIFLRFSKILGKNENHFVNVLFEKKHQNVGAIFEKILQFRIRAKYSQK